MVEKRPTYLFAVIEGEPWLSRAKEYKRRSVEAERDWAVYARKNGASYYVAHNSLHGLVFDRPRDRPKGWKAPGRKNRAFPEQKTEAGRAVIAELDALPKKMSIHEALDGAFIDTLRYGDKASGEWGMETIGFPWTPWLGWIGENFVARLPDAKAAAENFRDEHPGITIEPGPLEWALPEGFRRISEARYDLMVAEYKVSREEKAA